MASLWCCIDSMLRCGRKRASSPHGTQRNARQHRGNAAKDRGQQKAVVTYHLVDLRPDAFLDVLRKGGEGAMKGRAMMRKGNVRSVTGQDKTVKGQRKAEERQKKSSRKAVERPKKGSGKAKERQWKGQGKAVIGRASRHSARD